MRDIFMRAPFNLSTDLPTKGPMGMVMGVYIAAGEKESFLVKLDAG